MMTRALLSLALAAISLGCQAGGPGPMPFNTGDCRPDIGPGGLLGIVPIDSEDDGCFRARLGLVRYTSESDQIVVTGQNEEGQPHELVIEPFSPYTLVVCFDDDKAVLTHDGASASVHFEIRPSARPLLGSQASFDRGLINPSKPARLRVISTDRRRFVHAAFRRRVEQ